MINYKVIYTYSKSIYDIAVKYKKEKEYIEQLKYSIDILLDDSLKYILDNIYIDKNTKLKVINRIFENKINSYILEFIKLLIMNDRISLLPNICSEFEMYINKKENVLYMEVLSAYKLDDNLILSLKNKVIALFSVKDIKIVETIDKNLIGGVKLIINNNIVIDDTISNKLLRLRKLIGE